MKIVLLSNFINHHQAPIADELYRMPEVEYRFIETMMLPKEQRDLGYSDLSDRPYLLKSYLSETEYREAIKLINEADIVIVGAAPEEMVEERLKLGKLSFRYTERLFKERPWYFPDPRIWYGNWKLHIRYRHKPVYVLAASAYTANDVYAIGAYKGKVYKWGYFPAISKTSICSPKDGKNISILWCARFLKWKHPELAIRMAERLKDKGYSFQLDMIGTGKELNNMKSLVTRLGLEDTVSFLGSMPNESVITAMASHDIFVFTSDKMEGWGAVLNEAMSQACAVVSSNLAGAAPFLINDGVNGLLFKSGDLDSLTSQVARLFDDSGFIHTLSMNAARTMQEQWSPAIASRRLISLCTRILAGQDTEFKDGPCSKAYPYK